MRVISAFVASLVVTATSALLPAQEPRGATLTGTVRDSLAKPIANAEVVAQPDAHRTRTDSGGRFAFTALDGGRYTVRARKLGYAPAEWTADLSKDGRLDITLVLNRQFPTLDTVFVRADGQCSPFSLDGFSCRRKSAKGLYLDYTDIDDKGTTFTGDLFRDIDGFREEVRSSRFGPVRIPVPLTGWRCLNQLVDGRPLSGANRVPELSADVVAMEVYKSPDDVPTEYQRYTWMPPNARFGGRCSLVVYWTQLARTQP
jgi:carboxypeptidase family protein